MGVAIVATGMQVLAGSPPKPKAASAQPHRAPKVYGAPIQPPIIQKVRTKRRANTPASAKTTTAAQKKAHADAARRAQANLDYRRAHPAVSE